MVITYGLQVDITSFSLKSSRVDANTTEDGRAFQSLITDGKKVTVFVVVGFIVYPMESHVMSSCTGCCWNELVVWYLDQFVHNPVSHYHTGLQSSLLHALPFEPMNHVCWACTVYYMM